MRQLAQEIFIPAGCARAFTVSAGQVIRLAQVEEKQVADAVFLNAADHRESFHPGYSAILNGVEGIGGTRRLTKLYSKPPGEHVMATVTDDPVGVHWAYSGVRCSRMTYRVRDKVEVPPHRSCQDNLAEVLAPYGLGPDDVPEVFNIWMNVEIDPISDLFVIKPPLVGADGYIEIRADMELLVAISACPSDIAPVNDYRIKPLRVLIYDGG
jgi:uncharacterized protein YcgI (DUF1989 family)